MAETPPEGILNPLLRRADWRFLLPNPQPHVSICFARGFLAEAVRAISERMVDPKDQNAGSCDLAVAVDPNLKTLNLAWTALRAGGAFYTEWYSLFSSSPQKVKEKLIAAGFAEVTCYWAWPLPARAPALFWIPVEATGALRYFMTHRTPDLSLARHWLRALLRCGWWIARALGIINPIYATARKSMLADSSDQKDDRASLDIVRTNWEKWNLGKKPDSISWLLLTGGEKSYNKAVGLVFAESDSEPRVAVKMPRVATSIPNLLKEKTILEHLRASKQNHLQGIPRILFWEQTDSFAILGETVVKGIPLYTTLRSSNFHELAMSASKWLIDLAKHSQSIPPTDSWNRLIESLVGNFEESFSKIIDSNLINKARAILGGLAPLPLVCEQRDFSPWNVMVTANGQLAILDWESAKLDGLPAVDLIYFLAHAGFFLDHAWQSRRFRESYRASLNRSIFTGTVHFDALACYFHELGLDFSALPALRLLAWMLYARFAYERLVSRLVAQPTFESLREILFLGLWEEELHHV